MPETVATTESNYAQRTARASWQMFFVVAILAVVASRVPRGLPAFIVESLAFLTMVAGLICGLVAIAGISKVGSARVLWPALAGIILNGLLIFIFLTNFFAARNAAQQVHARAMTPARPTPAQPTQPREAAPPATHVGT